MLQLLSHLSETDLQAVAARLAGPLCDRAAEMKRELAAQELDPDVPHEKADGTDSKFAALPEAAYGRRDDFFLGLEKVGVPHPKPVEEMEREFTKKPDSRKQFESWNSGKIETTPEKELDFVKDLAQNAESEKRVAQSSRVELERQLAGLRFDSETRIRELEERATAAAKSEAVALARTRDLEASLEELRRQHEELSRGKRRVDEALRSVLGINETLLARISSVDGAREEGRRTHDELGPALAAARRRWARWAMVTRCAVASRRAEAGI